MISIRKITTILTSLSAPAFSAVFSPTAMPSPSLSPSRAAATTTHIERTGSSSRQDTIVPCRVDSICDISPTVKHLTLSPLRYFDFYPGQWVDVFIPESNVIGGYSMCSAPTHSDETKSFELAIKYSNYAPTSWIHHFCEKGMEVNVRVGGDVYLAGAEAASCRVVLLIAGGIGINPLLSIMKAGINYPSTRYHLIYTAKHFTDLIFRSDIDMMCRDHDNLSVKYHVTQDTLARDIGDNDDVCYDRVTPDDVNTIVKGYIDKEVPESDIRCYICGPPPMIDYFSERLILKPIFEKWW